MDLDPIVTLDEPDVDPLFFFSLIFQHSGSGSDQNNWNHNCVNLSKNNILYLQFAPQISGKFRIFRQHLTVSVVSFIGQLYGNLEHFARA